MLHELTLIDLSERLRNREVSSSEVTRALLDRIATFDGYFGSYQTVLLDRAIERALFADREIADGICRGPLHGVPIAIKDLCETTFAPTAAGMPFRANFVAPRDATVVERLEEAGAVIIGKLTMTEGALSQHRPELKVPRNPWNADHWTGTSSSGSGVATTLGFCYGALGSDTGGSIRYPSACNGVTGLKPTWGRVSLDGIWPLAPTMDHIGPMARTAADCATLLSVIAGADSRDPTTLPASVPNYLVEIGAGIRAVRIGFDRHYAEEQSDPSIVEALTRMRAVLESSGADFVEVSFPCTEDATASWLSICAHEAAAVHQASFKTHHDKYGRALSELIRLGQRLTNDELEKLSRIRQKFCAEVATVFASIDLLLLPVLSRNIPTLAALETSTEDRAWIRRFTTPFNLTGQPAITFPAGFDSAGLPIGLQLVAHHLREELLLRAAHAVQDKTDWHMRRPDMRRSRLRDK